MDGLGQCEYVRPPRRSGWYLYYGANATDNIALLRTLAGAGGTGYDRCLHVSTVLRIVRKRGIEFVVIVAVDVVVAQGAARPPHARAK